ncbi:phosphoribosylformylglycinamidine synthase subunit I [Alkalispirochaeta americana]|uniref:Phosphoribosylformylglycinamidine synthase subunit PurQ n=1 Tax=Alkalispirochaeta americana TaxID=159291 RepID=A0A1N6VCT5_9SPIO|nr:phosphoribosylformylglycinamidine synthase I [Alkalispirochaeta americana]SIQ75567.1 phosphoribosylformylglycinamidine synthase subunit I [Alkalispirochaeta americana]
MTIGIIQFPGTNCERESRLALERVGLEGVFFRWNQDLAQLRDFDGYLLAGGFSYEDRSRSGIIAALDPLMEVIRQESDRGKPVLGICNGAQILVEAGLVPGGGSPGDPPLVALTTNRRVARGRVVGTGFYNAWVTLRAETEETAFTGRIPRGTALNVPAAHAEGRFVMSPQVYQELNERGMIAFRYTDEEGQALEEFPVNPNGSVGNIAAITNVRGNVMAIMPHPERTPLGDGIFHSLREYLERGPGEEKARSREEAPSFSSSPAETRLSVDDLPAFAPRQGAHELVVQLIITDNAAVSVETALSHRGISPGITRRVHWELSLDPDLSPARAQEVLEAIQASGELYNSNKEECVPAPAGSNSVSLLVRERDDIQGRRVLEALQNWFGLQEVRSLQRGILWTLDEAQDLEQVLNTHILLNPVSQVGLLYDRR